MRDPRAVEAVVRLAGLVGAHLLERDRRGLGVGAVRHERGHAAHRDGAASMAGLHEQLGVGAHERGGHLHVGPVGHDELGPGVAEDLDDAEQVVPAAGVQARHVLAQLEEDLVHLERGRDRLDEHRGAHGALRDAERLLREHEHVVPQARLEVALELRQVVVRAVAVVDELPRGVEEVQAEVDERPRAPFAVDEHVLLGQVPAARPGDDGRAAHVGAERVGLALGRREGEGAACRIAQVAARCRRRSARSGLEASSRSASHTRAPELSALIAIFAGDAGPVISTRRSVSAGRRRRHRPVAGADVARSRAGSRAARRGRSVRGVVPRGEQLATARIEPMVQFLHEGERLVGEDLLAARDLDVTGDLDGHAAAAPFRG